MADNLRQTAVADAVTAQQLVEPRITRADAERALRIERGGDSRAGRTANERGGVNDRLRVGLREPQPPREYRWRAEQHLGRRHERSAAKCGRLAVGHLGAVEEHRCGVSNSGEHGPSVQVANGLNAECTLRQESVTDRTICTGRAPSERGRQASEASTRGRRASKT